MALPQTGLEAVIAGLSQFEAGSRTIIKAYDDIERKAGGVEKATGSLSSALSSLGSPLSALGGQFVGLGNSLLNIGTIAGGAALAGITAFGAGLATVVATSTMKAADLDQQMANIASTMGVTKEAVTPLKEEILNLALDPNLTVNTTQAASAIEKLAQNGLDMDQILDGAAKSTVALANATGDQGFTTSANIATGAMQAFNLEGDQLSKVADGVAGVLVKTKFNADDYAMALSNAGEIANSIGLPLDDFNTIIAATASSFTSGSDAGTSLKTLLQRFANPTEEAKGLMNDLGIAVFDNNGNMRDAKDIVGDLNQAFEGMTDQQRANTAAIIGGADASRTLLGLAGMTKDEFAALSGEVNKNGQALQMAATRVDSVQGAMDIFRGIIEATQIQIGDKFLPILKDMTVNFSEIATKIGPKVVDFFGGIANLIPALIDKGTQLFDTFGDKGLAGVFASLGVGGGALFFKKLSTLFQLITGDAGTLGETIQSTLGTALEWLTANIFPILSTGVQFIIDHFEEFKGALFGIGAVLAGGVFAAIVAGVLSLLTPINLIIAGAALLGAAWAGNWGGIQEKTFAAWAVIQPVLQQLIDWLGVNIPIAIQATVDFWTTTLQPALEATGAFIMTTVVPALMDIGTWLQTNIPIAIQAMVGFWNSTLLPAFTATGDFIQNTVIPAFVQVWEWLQTNIPLAIQTVTDFWNTYLLPAITGISNFITTVLIPAFVSIGTWLNTNIATAIQTVSNLWTNIFLPAITGVWSFISGSVLPLFASVANVAEAVLGKAIEALAGLWENVLLPALTIAWNYISNNVMTQWNTLTTLLKVTVGGAIRILSNLWQQTLQPALKSVWDFISTNIMPVFNALVTIITDKLKPNINEMSTGFLPKFKTALEAVKKIIQEVTSFFNSLASAVKNFELPPVLQRHSPSPFEQTLMGIASSAGIAQAALDKLLGVTRIADPIREAIGAARDDVEKFFDSMKIEGSKSDLTLSILSQAFRENSAEILGATDRVAKFQEVLGRTGVNFERIFAGGSSNPFAGKGGGAVSVFLTNFDKRFEEMEKAARDMFIRAGRTAVTIGNQLNSMAASLIDPMADHLNDTVSTLTELIQGAAAAGAERISFEGQIISATQAQEMLNQALAKQRDIQDELTKLRENEMKLGFLEKQLTLMETLQKAGIDIDSVLGGLKLGIDASIPDIVAATNKLVEAMIAQMDEDLQIGSPSKVAVDKAKNFGLSFAEGIKAQGSAIMSAIQGAISAPLIAAPALGAGSATTNVYNINNGGNTINSGMDEATFDARVRQSLQRMMGT